MLSRPLPVCLFFFPLFLSFMDPDNLPPPTNMHFSPCGALSLCLSLSFFVSRALSLSFLCSFSYGLVYGSQCPPDPHQYPLYSSLPLLSLCVFISFPLALSLSFSLSLFLSLSLSLFLSLFLYLSLAFSLSFSLYFSISLCLTQTLP